MTLLGSEAGNFALKVIATGGFCLGGGIAPKILNKLGSAAFREALISKGPMHPVLEEIPVCVILDDETALRGAARCAARRG